VATVAQLRALVRAARPARDALFHGGHTDVSWADALVELAQRSLDATSLPRRERFRANWFIDPKEPIPARWTDGLAVPHWLRDLLLCDGTVSPVFTDGARPVSVGRTQREVPDRTRRLVLQRDKKCRVPWCSQTRWLQVHHIIHDEHQGPTDTWNLAAICPACHRLHHKGALGISGSADQPNGLTFTDAHGRVLDPAAHPTKPTGPPPAPAHPYQHPLGERLRKSEIFFPDPPV
jgi:HNH endonuclease